MQLLCILLAANRVHTVNFQAFLASDESSICLVTIFVFVFFNICICVVRYLYYLDILAGHALLGNKTSNHSSDPPSGLSKAGSCISVIYKYLMVLLLFSSPTEKKKMPNMKKTAQEPITWFDIVAFFIFIFYTVYKTTSLELASSKARATPIKFTKIGVSQSVS